MKYLITLLIFIFGLNIISWLSITNQFSIDAATFDAPLLPESDNLYNLGSSASNQRWQNGFLSGNLTTAGNISIGTTTISEKLTVIDGNISNINNIPVRIGKITLPLGENMESGGSIAISGRYAYILAKTSSGNPNIVVVIDISNPSNPARVGAVTLNLGENYGESIVVAGRYVYVLTYTNPTKIVVVDISNPSNPTRMGAVTLSSGEDYGRSIAVSGRYAYISTNTIPTRVVIIDISNPSAPVRIGAVTLAGGENNGLSIAVSGRYAYITTDTTPARVVVVDISNPSNPIIVSAVTLGSGEDYGYSIAVSGRYAYITTNTTPARVVVINIKGLEAVSANIHSLEAGNLQVRNDIIAQGQLQITGGINVGTGGIFSAGPISVSIATTRQTNAMSGYFQATR